MQVLVLQPIILAVHTRRNLILKNLYFLTTGPVKPTKRKRTQTPESSKSPKAKRPRTSTTNTEKKKKKPQFGKERHFSFLAIGEKINMDEQHLPGPCFLCEGSRMSYKSELKRHLKLVHWSRKIKCKKGKILFCKCSAVESRGSDQAKRNGHYHCPKCIHPLQDKRSLRRHLTTQHDFDTDDLPPELVDI